ncbi:4122_t:CDS:2, partial [Gigaspora rosea]
FLTNAAFITVVGYNNNDNESNPIPIRFGKELFNEPGEKLMAILIAISAFGCATQYSAMIYHGTSALCLYYCISWFFVLLGAIIWYIRNRKQNEKANRELIQNEEFNSETDQNEESIGETEKHTE